MSTGGIDNVIILPKGHFLQTPLSTYYNHSTVWYSHHNPLYWQEKELQTASKSRKWQGQDSNPVQPSAKSTLSTTFPELNLPERAVWAKCLRMAKRSFRLGNCEVVGVEVRDDLAK